jgi:hypothetical protein
LSGLTWLIGTTDALLGKHSTNSGFIDWEKFLDKLRKIQLLKKDCVLRIYLDRHAIMQL